MIELALFTCGAALGVVGGLAYAKHGLGWVPAFEADVREDLAKLWSMVHPVTKPVAATQPVTTTLGPSGVAGGVQANPAILTNNNPAA